MSDPKNSNPSQPDGGPTKGHSPVVRIIEWVVIGALGLVVANEAYSKFSYDATFANLEKAIDAAEAAGDALASDEVAPLISGMPSRKEVVDGRKTLIDYQWRSLFKTYRIVVHTAPDGGQMVVLSFETDAPPEPPEPAAVAGDGNSPSPGPMMPGGGGSGGPAGMPGGGPSPMGGGAERPELESEGDDQPEDSDDEADEPVNQPSESDEVSEESDETTDETEEAPEEAGETTEGTEEATEDTDPSA